MGFAFCYLLRFHLLPRSKNLKKQRLYRPNMGEPDTYTNLQSILTRPTNRESIAQQYDEVIKYATAVSLGTAEAESISRRFTCTNGQYPTYKVLIELGKAQKTIFLCRYLRSEALRRGSTKG